MDFYDLRRTVVDDPKAAEDAIRVDPLILSRRNRAGETLLHFFAIENDLSRVDWLRQLGGSVNVHDEFGATPLMHAVRLDYSALAEYLLAQGADVDAKTVNGDTALSYAVMKSKAEFAQRLL